MTFANFDDEKIIESYDIQFVPRVETCLRPLMSFAIFGKFSPDGQTHSRSSSPSSVSSHSMFLIDDVLICVSYAHLAKQGDDIPFFVALATIYVLLTLVRSTASLDVEYAGTALPIAFGALAFFAAATLHVRDVAAAMEPTVDKHNQPISIVRRTQLLLGSSGASTPDGFQAYAFAN